MTYLLKLCHIYFCNTNKTYKIRITNYCWSEKQYFWNRSVVVISTFVHLEIRWQRALKFRFIFNTSNVKNYRFRDMKIKVHFWDCLSIICISFRYKFWFDLDCWIKCSLSLRFSLPKSYKLWFSMIKLQKDKYSMSDWS